ncbi:NADH oxidase [Chlamydia trachomatis]|nr:NADH oxidase [Chlamydia trachomatis]
MQSRIIPNYFDEEFTSKMEYAIRNHGIELNFGEKVEKFLTEDGVRVSGVQTDKHTYEADLVILAIGFRPNTQILEGLEKLPNGAVLVDEFQRSTVDKDVYVIGDSASM